MDWKNDYSSWIGGILIVHVGRWCYVMDLGDNDSSWIAEMMMFGWEGDVVKMVEKPVTTR